MADRSEYWNPQTLGYKFLAEAKRLWEMEQFQPKSLTTLQATLIINIVINSDSMDKLGLSYSEKAIAMAEELDIFGPLTTVTSERVRQAYTLTSWCLYFWVGIQCYFFMIPPLIKSPPNTSLPDADEHREWYPELWLQYPDGRTPCPTKFSHLFVAKSRLIDILNRIAFNFFKKKGEYLSPEPMTIVNSVADLQKWYSDLPRCLGPTEVVFPSQLKLQYVSCAIVLASLLF